jgi:putative colanic acid biosynthesis glycosyltransferase
MKLLQINTVVNYGSTGRIAEEIGIIALSKGYDSTIAFGRKNGESKSKLIRIENKLGNYIHVAKTRLTDKHGLGSKSATHKFIAKIKAIKPDIIHLHNIHGYYLNYEILFNFLNNEDIPIVWTLHDCWPITGHCSYFDLIACEKWITGCNNCPQISSYPASFVDNSFFNYELKKSLFQNKNLTLVPVSKWLASIISKSFLKEQKSVVINNGVNTNIFKPITPSNQVIKKYNPNKKKVILGVASVWENRKGLDDFIRLNSLINDNEIIILVGVTTNQIKYLPKNIIGIKRTNSINELAELYSLADVFVNPTYEDNFPTTNLEAMACGTPVVTYKTGGSPESITADTGRVAQKGDLNGLYLAISEILSTEDKKTMNNCVNNARQNYEMHSQFLKYFDLYESILSKKIKSINCV